MTDKTELEEALIYVVQQHPCLYSKKDFNYRNKLEKESVWAEIGEALDRSSEACKSQWKSIRQQYLAFVKKVHSHGVPGKSSSFTRPHFRHEKLMEFCQESPETETTNLITASPRDGDSGDADSDVETKCFADAEDADFGDDEQSHCTTRSLSKLQRNAKATSITTKRNLEDQLITLIVERPELYDTSTQNYKNKKLTSRIWEEIAETLDISGKGMQTGGSKCESMWKGLRSQYVAYLLKLRTSKSQSGLGMNGEIYFRHAEAMQFLSEFVNPKKAAFVRIPTTVRQTTAAPQHFDIRPSASTQETRVNRTLGQAQIPSEDSRAEPLKPLTIAPDEVDHFLCSLAPALRRVQAQNPRKCAEVKLKFLQLLTEAEYDN